MLSKKNVDKNMLISIKEMFPENKQIDYIINEFNKHLEYKNKEKDKTKTFNYDY